MFRINKISNKTLLITFIALTLLCILWHVFFSQFYRLTYTFLSLTFINMVWLFLRNKKQVVFFIKDYLQPKTANMIISTIMVLAIVSAINYVASKNEYKVDLTRNKINTLSDQTIKILKNLKDGIHYIGFIDQTTQGAYFRSVMEKYRYYSNNISYEMVDPNTEPLKARAYNVTTYGTIIAFKGKDETKADYITEEALTNAIIRLNRTEKKQIYFMTGHMERDIDSIAPESYSIIKDIIFSQAYLVEKLNIMKTGKIPKNTDLLIIAGPKKTFFDREVALIVDYIKKGGPFLILSDPSLPDETVQSKDNVNKITSKFGFVMNNDIVVDPGSRLFGLTDAMPVIQDYDASSVITAGFNDEPTIYPFAQSINVSKVDTKKYNIYKLCKTSPSSWGETASRSGNISFNKTRDRQGPLSICVNLVEGKERGVNIVAFGNSSFISNKYVSHAANIDIFMNSVSFLLNDDDLLAIRPRTDEVGRVNIPTNPAFALISVYIIPFTVLGFGIVYWYRRRRK